jgi:hypothetical protein
MGKVELRIGKTGKGKEKDIKGQEKGMWKKPGCKISQRNIHRQMT